MENTIGKNIHRLRIAKGYTQETLAQYLHVSNVAISKWEHGISCPDISTLPILARIFDCSVDELLNFKKNLSEEDIDRLVREALQKFSETSYDEAMKNIFDLVREYPNSELLKLKVAGSHITVSLLLKDEEKSKQFHSYAKKLCEELLASKDLQIAQSAAIILAPLKAMDHQVEEALGILHQIPKLQDTTALECLMMSQMEDTSKARALLQEQLYTSLNKMGLLLSSLINLELKDEQPDDASQYIYLLEQLNTLFRIECQGTDNLFMYYAKLKDKDHTLRYLKEYLRKLKQLDKLVQRQNDSLATLPWFKYVPQKNTSNPLPDNMMEGVINPMLESIEELDFLREDPDYKELLSKII